MKRQDKYNMKHLESESDIKIEMIKSKLLKYSGTYFFLLLLSILFMGPFLFATISSFKDEPNSWPPTLKTAQLSPKNWAGSFKMANQAGKKGLFGHFMPDREFNMTVSYLVSKESLINTPKVIVPKRIGFAGGATLKEHVFAADYIDYSINEKKRETIDDKIKVSYLVSFQNPSEQIFDKVPLDLKVDRDMEFYEATVTPNRIESRGKVQSWNNLVSGVIPYIFHQYNRVFSENYSRSTGRALFTQWIINSFKYAFVKVLTTLLFASMAGYTLARMKFRGKNVLFAILLFSMMIPQQVTFISNYLVLKDGLWGFTKIFGINSLLNSYTGLVLSSLVDVASVFIFKQFFEGLPDSYEESAKIDGANAYQTFFQIMLPLAKPAMGAVTILSFQGAWNDFFMPLVILTSPTDNFPLTTGLMSFQKTYAAGAFDWGPMLAGAVISALPIIILFVLFQRYFVEGVSFSGTKG